MDGSGFLKSGSRLAKKTRIHPDLNTDKNSKMVVAALTLFLCQAFEVPEKRDANADGTVASLLFARRFFNLLPIVLKKKIDIFVSNGTDNRKRNVKKGPVNGVKNETTYLNNAVFSAEICLTFLHYSRYSFCSEKRTVPI